MKRKSEGPSANRDERGIGRRGFLLSSAALAAGGLIGKAVGGNQSAPPGPFGNPATDAAPIPTIGKIAEPAREIPIVAQADVVVVGGGPAGVTAALAAARTGASTILVERYNHLGGLWTGGLILPTLAVNAMGRDGKQQQNMFGLGWEIIERLFKTKMVIKNMYTVDPEGAKYMLDEMMVESKVQTLYHCWGAGVIASDGVIKAVVLESKSGRVAITPKVVVDCTGDGDIFAAAGEGFEHIRLGIGLWQRIGNCDRIDKSKPGFKPISFIGSATPIPGVLLGQGAGGETGDALNLFDISRIQQKLRMSIWKKMEEIRAMPGYEEVFLLEVAQQIGVRASRLLDGLHKLTVDDSMTFKTFEDTIGVGGSWTSIMHGEQKVARDKRPVWQIPYRALVPKKTKNLLVAGRCISHEKGMVEDVRVVGTCLITGHGAGVAAALAVRKGVAVQDNDIAAIRKTLLEQKAFLG